MLDLTREPPLTLAQACRHVPPGRGGSRTHISTLLRWLLTGARAPAGRPRRGGPPRRGGRWVPSREALQRFAGALPPRLASEPAPAPRSPAKRRRESDQAARELAKRGI